MIKRLVIKYKEEKSLQGSDLNCKVIPPHHLALFDYRNGSHTVTTMARVRVSDVRMMASLVRWTLGGQSPLKEKSSV